MVEQQHGLHEGLIALYVICFCGGWASEEVCRWKQRMPGRLERQIRNTLAAAPLDFLRKMSTLCLPGCRSVCVQNVESCVEV